MSPTKLPRLYERVVGAGDPTMLLHAAASSGAQWRPVMDRLAKRQRVIVPDLFGEGDSVSAPSAWTVLDADLEALQRRLEQEPKPVLLVGHSYGASHMSPLTHPDFVAGSILTVSSAREHATVSRGA